MTAPSTPAPVVGSPGQLTTGLSPVSTNFGPLVMTVEISLSRAPRGKCVACGNRRVLFYVGLGDIIKSPLLCARCAGIR
jgi:hypothetical protein